MSHTKHVKEMIGWKPVVGLENLFEVSNQGDVRYASSKQIVNASYQDGYCIVSLDGCQKRVHRLVAEAFIDNPDNLPVVDHIDHDRSNNNFFNLRWVSYSTNNFNKSCHGNRIYKYVNDLQEPWVKINQYGKWLFDKLYYCGPENKFYMYIDDVVGYREIIPTFSSKQYRIYCQDTARIPRCIRLDYLTNFAIDLCLEEYGDKVIAIEDDD